MTRNRIRVCLLLTLSFLGATSASADDLRVLVWNAWRGGNEVERGPEKVLEVIREAKPDLVLMQESYDIADDRPTLGRWIADELGWTAHQGESPHLCVISARPFTATHFHDPWHGLGVRIEDEKGRAFVAWSIWLDYRAYLTYALRDDPTITDEALLALETESSSRFTEAKALLEAVNGVSGFDPSVPTLVGGDFNCPSHLDWTVDTTRMYRHRRSLDLPVSLAMAEDGFRDVFRDVHPDPIQRPGITWSPMFREKGDGVVQAFDRIDRLYLRNPERGAWKLVPLAATTLPQGWEDDRIPVRQRVFPSDHGAVVLDLRWERMASRPIEARLDSIERISGDAAHSAFTDLLRVGDRLYGTFREGDGHVHGADGRIRVLARDGEGPWESVSLLAEEGIDLRDPKLSQRPDGRVMLLCGGSDYRDRVLVGRRSRVAFSDDDGGFGPLRPIEVDPEVRTDDDWLWRVTWDRNGTAYGVLYQPGNDGSAVRLLSSQDGVRWKQVADLPLEGQPNETTLRFDSNGELQALVRREGDDSRAMFGRAEAPFDEWTFQVLPEAVGGPDFVRGPGNDGWIIAGRRYGDEGPQTNLWWRGDDGSWETLLTLPSSGDTSYPGLVLEGDRLLVSYYSSHEERSAVYLATIRVRPRDDGGSMVPADAGIGFESEVAEIVSASRPDETSYEGTMLVGSSVFRLWADAEDDLSDFDVVNHGFGGSRTWELLEYAPTLIEPFRPHTIVVYCGSNDINAGASASRIVDRLEIFTRRMKESLPGVQVAIVSVNRAPQKIERWPVVDAVNQQLRIWGDESDDHHFIDVNDGLFDSAGKPRLDLYLDDGLHFTPEAYDEVFQPRLKAFLRGIQTPADSGLLRDDRFQAWDRDGDGRLVPGELPESLRRNFSGVDRNDDGYIDLPEHLAMTAGATSRNASGVRLVRDVTYGDDPHPRRRLSLAFPRQSMVVDPLPMVVYIHGGGWQSGEHEQGIEVVRGLVASGRYAGASIGYRLTGEVVWPTPYEDCRDAIDWIRRHAAEFGVDPDRIVAFGHSAGGHLAAMLAVDGGSNRLAGAIDFFGPTDLLSMDRQMPPDGMIHHDAPNSPESRLVGGPLQDRPKIARSASPIEFVDSTDPPLLVVHGDRDRLVPFEQSVAFVRAIREAGGTPIFIRVAEGGHGGFRNPAIFDVVRHFLEHHLHGRKTGPRSMTLPATAEDGAFTSDASGREGR